MDLTTEAGSGGRRALLFITPARPDARLPSRPARLLDALVGSKQFARAVAIHRVVPAAWLRYAVGRLGKNSAWGQRVSTELLVHPLPFGRPERWLLARVIRSYGRWPGPVVVWISDPKSATVLDERDRWAGEVVAVFDAYDAWDESPLVRGRWRRSAVGAGYAAAVRGADLVFANTPFVAGRFQDWGARNVQLLANAAPPVDRRFWPDVNRPYVAYVGRIHERLDPDILWAIARAYPSIGVVVAGPLERRPPGWERLTARPNVRVVRVTTGTELSRLLGQARALVIPHRLDSYSLSQDAMKAWDALAVGTPVISTPVPPAASWPQELAILAEDGPGFVDAVGRVLSGELDGWREARFAYAEANSWSRRAAEALASIARSVPSWR